MKHNIQIIYIFIFLVLLGAGCQKMDDSYRKYVVPGGKYYPEKPRDAGVRSGKGRVQVFWLKGTDPTVKRATIFWNGGMDSVAADVTGQGDTINKIIDGLKEQQYTFEMYTYDDQGNKSIAAEAIGASYGTVYQNSLLNRPINSGVVNDNGEVTVYWGAASSTNGAISTEVSYTDNQSKTKKQTFPVSDIKSVINDLKDVSDLKYRTVFLPDSMAIDTFYTAFDSFDNFLMDKSAWNVIDFSSQHDNSADNRVTNIIDGNPGTRWHCWLNSNYPHYVVIDMNKIRPITAFEIFRMTDDDRACDQFTLAVSDDNIKWNTLGTYDFNRFINGGQLYAMPKGTKGRYFKFTGIAGPLNYMVMGEINVYGR